MATPEIEIHHRFFRNSIYSSFPQFFEEISAILSRGSISFGRYADDSIAWEKRSVFTYNRCEEELQKFQAPGFKRKINRAMLVKFRFQTAKAFQTIWNHVAKK
ncbi:hypothetical protein V6Z12_D13G140300 [Gossypium hirsutum]